MDTRALDVYTAKSATCAPKKLVALTPKDITMIDLRQVISESFANLNYRLRGELSSPECSDDFSKVFNILPDVYLVQLRTHYFVHGLCMRLKYGLDLRMADMSSEAGFSEGVKRGTVRATYGKTRRQLCDEFKNDPTKRDAIFKRTAVLTDVPALLTIPQRAL